MCTHVYAGPPGARPRREGGPFESSFTFLRVKGIAIGAHWTWLLVFGLVVWSLADSLFPRTYPGLSNATYWAMGLITAVLFFGSVLLHELGHAIVGVRNNMEIDGITLWLFGGVARIRSSFPSPGAEFRIAIAGPAISLVIGVVFALLAFGGSRLDWPDQVQGVVDYLARINFIVLAFNLVPALPLDGGRVLRSWLWHAQRSFYHATLNAARAGQLFGIALVGVGVLGFFSGADVGGLWFAFIGWFLLSAARSEVQQAALLRAVSGARVRDFMRPDPATVVPNMRLDLFLEEAAGPEGHSSYPVVEDGDLTGFVTIRRAATVPRADRRKKRVKDVMAPRTAIPTIPPDTPVAQALEELQAGDGRAVVTEGDRMVGLLTMADLARAITAREAEPERVRVRRAPIAAWIAIVLVIILAVGFLYRPPVAVLAPGLALDVSADIRITGVPTKPNHGAYLLTAVSLQRPSAIGALWALFRGDRDVVALSTVIPRGVNEDRFIQQQRGVFQESRMIAAVAAARAIGMPVQVRGTGAIVISVVPDSAAERAGLRQGDVIVRIDSARIRVAADAVREVRSHPAGTEVRLTVERAGRTVRLSARTQRLQPEGVVGVGAVLDTRDFSVRLPFTISFRNRDVAGPSAGLAYALAIADLLDAKDYANGHTIAATGTIDANGGVGPVGGVDLKVDAAKGAGADLFLVPSNEIDQARGNGLRVRGVDTLREALRALRPMA